MTTTASNRLRRALLIGGIVASGALHAQNAPVYSTAQAERGMATYNGAGGCAACHGADLSGGQFGPSLKGVSFRSRWSGMTMAELFAQLKQMPPGGSGSLGDAVYADLDALILSQNNFAAGSAFPTEPAALSAMAMPGERRAE